MYGGLWPSRALFVVFYEVLKLVGSPHWAAEFFLGAWLQKAHDVDLEEHRQGPSRAVVRAYAEAME